MNNRDKNIPQMKDLSIEELKSKAVILKKELLMMKIKKAYEEEFKDTSQMKKHRKQIARCMTFINAKSKQPK